MARGMNDLALIGNIGRDPASRTLSTGTKQTSTSIAVGKPARKGEEAPDPEWFNLSFYGRLAEIAAQYLKKGSLVYVRGPVSLQQYTDKKSGQPRASMQMKVDKLHFLDTAPKAQQVRRPEPVDEYEAFEPDLTEDDLPF